MLRHMRILHNPQRSEEGRNKYSKPARCLFCNMEMSPPPMKNLIQHYINAHEQPIQLKIRTFDSPEDYVLWRQAAIGTLFKLVPRQMLFRRKILFEKNAI